MEEDDKRSRFFNGVGWVVGKLGELEGPPPPVLGIITEGRWLV